MLHRREDSSRRRAVLPRTSHPWFPPALEPLNHSVVQRFDVAAALNRPILSIYRLLRVSFLVHVERANGNRRKKDPIKAKVKRKNEEEKNEAVPG